MQGGWQYCLCLKAPSPASTSYPSIFPAARPPQSWLCGKLLGWLEPASVALLSSRGYETPSSKMAMRATVIIADLMGE